MSKNVCPHCGEKISIWKKFQLTDYKIPRKCNSCEKRILLPEWYSKFIKVFNIIVALILVLLTWGLTDTRIMMLAIGAVAMIVLNLLMVGFITILKVE